jgi:hypothetical protein
MCLFLLVHYDYLFGTLCACFKYQCFPTLECHNMWWYQCKLTTIQRKNKKERAYSSRECGLQQGDTQKEVSNVKMKNEKIGKQQIIQTLTLIGWLKSKKTKNKKTKKEIENINCSCADYLFVCFTILDYDQSPFILRNYVT